MQVLEPPRVYYYETPSDPTLQDLETLMLADGADLTDNVLGLLVQTPPSEFLGVERYDFEVYYGAAYDELTRTQYRNREALDWLARGAQDDPRIVVDNLETTIAEVQAGREPFAWQIQQDDQTTTSLALLGVGLAFILLIAALVYGRFRQRSAKKVTKKAKPTSVHGGAGSYGAGGSYGGAGGYGGAKARLEQAYLNARYSEDLVETLDASAPEAEEVRELLFSEKPDHKALLTYEIELKEHFPKRPDSDSDFNERTTPFDNEIRAAFKKLEQVLSAKRLEIERCYFNTDRVNEAGQRIEQLHRKLRQALDNVADINAQTMLEEQLTQLQTLETNHEKRKATYANVVKTLQEDIRSAKAYKADLLKKREVYALLEASVRLQRDLSREDEAVTLPSGDIREVLDDVDDLIAGYMETPLPTYSSASLVEIEDLLK